MRDPSLVATRSQGGLTVAFTAWIFAPFELIASNFGSAEPH
jgi:hypothetical protein